MAPWHRYNPFRWLRKQAVILMYHRIATPTLDPWQLAVSPAAFEQHLRVLRAHAHVVPLAELVDRINGNKLDKNYVAITFDDGYIDNYETALPLLEHYALPATFFITHKNIDTFAEFWWDELAGLLLESPTLPNKITLPGAETTFHFDLGNDTLLTAEKRAQYRTYLACAPVDARTQLYLKLWEYLSPLPDAQQQATLAAIRQWAGVGPLRRAAYRSVTARELQHLSVNPLVTIGAHTSSHPALTCHSAQYQEHEISSNKQFLEQLLQQPIQLFAYPSGNFNATTTALVQQLGFSAAFTTRAESITPQTALGTLGRFQVNEQTGEEFRQALVHWFDS
ncbi:polysaccharide deacetylase family protein [Hymenobacter aerilatus]|uniref:Polysaccharide deacetylase family protein n=1 Tax=Hymenobacter aerilatus TaxID=2932251 RepID=A0A8T9SQI1_9BACT|nr:polysaccharide deacetylase family protein [Hymenobacter aerilatus]UOR04418.1 polysaccharide deacetylase family protein [Hymenobacter aerilatus]